MTTLFCRLMLFAFCGCLFTCFQSRAISAEKEELPPPPPMAQSDRISIYRGQTIEIPLRIIGHSTPPVKFIIRSQPKHGKLENLQITQPDTATITYLHNDADGPGYDSFTFAAQASDTAVSAPGRIEVIILEKPPIFSMQHELDFGDVFLGETAERELVIENTGGGVISGTLNVPAPWVVVGEGSYDLKRGEEAKIRLKFQPTEVRRFFANINFSNTPDEAVVIEGAGLLPFEVTPTEIEFHAAQGEALRKAVLKIKNFSIKDSTLKISAPNEIVCATEVNVPAKQEVALFLQIRPDFHDASTGSLVVSGSNFSQCIAYYVFATPPKLEVTPCQGINFGQALEGRQYKAILRVRNNGGSSIPLRADWPPEISIDPDPNSFLIAPGNDYSFSVFFTSGKDGDFNGFLNLFAGDGQKFKIPLSAKIVSMEQPVKTFRAEALFHPEVVPSTDSSLSYNQIPPIKDIKLVTGNSHFIEISWEKPSPDAIGYKIEQRTLQIGPDGLGKIGWIEWKNAKIREEKNQIIARFDRLPSDEAWIMRISSLDRGGAVSKPSLLFRMATASPTHWKFPWWILIVIAAGWGFYVFRKKRKAIDNTDAERIARLGKL